MDIEIFMALLGIGILFTIYSFLIRDLNNFTHILTGFISGILLIFLGYSTFEGISNDFMIVNSGVISVESIVYTPGNVGGFLCLLGVIMILYTVVLIVDITQTKIGDL